MFGRVMSSFAKCGPPVLSVIKGVAAWFAREFDIHDLVLAIGLALLAIGLAQVWVPAAFIVPGVIIVCVAIFGPRLARQGETD